MLFIDIVLYIHSFGYYTLAWSLLQELIKYLVCKGCLCDFIAEKIAIWV